MVSTRSSAQQSTFFTPFNVKSLSLNVPPSRTKTTSKRTVQTRRTSPRLQVKLKASPAPKENVSCSAPRRSPRIHQLQKLESFPSTRSGLKYGRGYVNPRSVKPREHTWGQWTQPDSDNWNPAAWSFSSHAVPAWP